MSDQDVQALADAIFDYWHTLQPIENVPGFLWALAAAEVAQAVERNKLALGQAGK
jgi:hypothetical protein